MTTDEVARDAAVPGGIIKAEDDEFDGLVFFGHRCHPIVLAEVGHVSRICYE